MSNPKKAVGTRRNPKNSPPTPMPSEGPYKVEDAILTMIGGLCLYASGHRRTPCTANDECCECCHKRRIVQEVANLAHSRALASHSDAVRELVRAAKDAASACDRCGLVVHADALRSVLSNPALVSLLHAP